ncbi:MAG: flippase [Ardenticatenaceae bacterium]
MVDVVPTTVDETKTSDTQIVFNNTLIMITRRAVLWVFSGVMVLFLPRYLGDEGLGQLAFAQSIAALFTTVLTLGLGEYLVKEIARNRSLIHTHLGSAIGLRLVMSLVVVGSIFLVANFTGQSETARLVLYVAAATAIAQSFVRLMSAVLYGIENMSLSAIAEVAGRVLVIAVGVPVLIQSNSVVAYAVVLLGGMLINLAITVLQVANRFPIRINLDMPKIKSLVIGSTPFLLMGIMLDVYNQTDTIVLRAFTSDAVVGWYAAANNVYKTIDMLPLALTAAILPTLSRVHHSGATASITIAKKGITVGAIIIVPLALGISLFSEVIIDTLPDPDTFQNTVPLLTILALTIPVTTFLMILGTIAVAVDRQKAWAIALFATVILNVILNVIAAPLFQTHYGNGGIGVALTTLLTEGFMVGIGIWLMPKGVIDRAMVSTIARVLISGGIMTAAVFLTKYAGLGPAAMVGIGGVTYGVAALATRAITKGDIRFIRDTAASKWKAIRPS